MTSQPALSVNFNQIDKDFLNRYIGDTNSYAIIIIKHAKGTYSIDFNKYTFLPNSLIIISKNQNITLSFQEKQHEFIALIFSPDFTKNSDENVLQMLSFCIREHFEGKQILQLEDKDYNYLKGLCRQLDEINIQLKDEIRVSSSFHFLQLILIYCASLYTKQSADKIQSFNKVITNFTALLETNFRNVQKVHFYTETLNLTYNSLARHTNNYCNKTPKEIITERLILEIKRLLAGTDISIKEISYNLGFGEPTNMVKYFKKISGITPSEFRNRSKNYHSL